MLLEEEIWFWFVLLLLLLFSEVELVINFRELFIVVVSFGFVRRLWFMRKNKFLKKWLERLCMKYFGNRVGGLL